MNYANKSNYITNHPIVFRISNHRISKPSKKNAIIKMKQKAMKQIAKTKNQRK